MSDGRTDPLNRVYMREWTPSELGISSFDVTQVASKSSNVIDLGGFREFTAQVLLDVEGAAPTAGVGALKIELLASDGTSIGTYTLGSLSDQLADRNAIISWGAGHAPGAGGDGTVSTTSDVRFCGLCKLIWDQTTLNDAGTSATVSVRLFALS